MTTAPKGAMVTGKAESNHRLGSRLDSAETGRAPQLHRQLPPYGRRLLALRRRRQVPFSREVVISVGSWELVNCRREDALVMPPDSDPAMFTWSIVAGLAVRMIVYETDLALADKVAAQVIAARCLGCVCLIVPAFGERIGGRVYKSFRHDEVRHAA